MKLLAVCVLVLSVMAWTRADPEPDSPADQEEVDLVQRSSCPPSWSPINNRCFRYVPKPMTWAKAESHCLSMGANLASVHDMNEYHQVQSLITTATYGSKETWIGGTNAQETSIWFWSDGSRLDYTNWCDGQPDNGGNNQHCLQMNFSDEKCWDDQTCSVHLPSVCAKDAGQYEDQEDA